MIKNAALTAVAVAVASSAASAQTVVSWAYNNLGGSYDATTGIFTARAVDMTGLQTVGDVSRVTSPTGDADFAAGFVSAADPANVVVEISVTAIDQVLGIAFGTGTFVFTDRDGTTLSGTLVGTWVRGGLGQTFFNGDVVNASFANGASFDGDTGSFLTDLGFPAPYEGASTTLFLRPGDGGFFTSSFRDVATSHEGVLIPTPGAMALAGLAGLAMARRRR